MKILKTKYNEKYVQAVGNKNEVDEIMWLSLHIHRIFGQHILDPRWTWKRFWVNQLLSALLSIYVIIGTCEILKNTTDVKLVAEACYTFLIVVSFPSKYLLLVNKRFVFRKLYVALKSTLYDAIKEDSADKLKDILDKGKKVVSVFFGMLVFPVVIYLLAALWFYVHGERVTMSKTTSILMPMRTPYYELGLILHCIYMFEASFTIVSIVLWFALLMFFFCVTCDVTVNKLAVEKRQPDEDQLEYAIRLNDTLRSFYEIHVELVDYLNTLNVMFKWLALVPLISVTLSICLLLLLMSKGVDWTFISNTLAIFGELFAYNWFGEQIKNKANNWNMALLNFDWTNMRVKDQKNYYIIMFYMQKNFGVRTAIGTDLSFVTMSAVLKASYQAFTVLQTMDG